jgi:hypothetical protein
MTWSPRLYAPAVSSHGHALAVAAAVAAAVGAILVFGLTIDARMPADVVLQSSNSTAIAISPVAPAPGAVAQPSLAAEGATPAPPTTASSTEPTQQRPVFDILRLEPGGAAVIAGHASANAALELRADGRVVAEANANHLGDFTMSPPPFETGPHRLELAARSGASPAVFSDPVAIDVPTREAKSAAAPASPSGDAAAAPQAAPAPAGSADVSSSEASQSNSPMADVASASRADGVTVALRTPTPPPRPNFARLPTKYPEARPVKGGRTSVALLPPAVDPSYDRGGHTTK